jgi:acetate kinase
MSGKTSAVARVVGPTQFDYCYAHRLVAAVDGMMATLGGLDTLVFTGGNGEHSPDVRQAAATGFEFAGVHLGSALTTRVGDRDVAGAHSAVRVLVVAAREDLGVLAKVRRLVLHQGD